MSKHNFLIPLSNMLAATAQTTKTCDNESMRTAPAYTKQVLRSSCVELLQAAHEHIGARLNQDTAVISYSHIQNNSFLTGNVAPTDTIKLHWSSTREAETTRIFLCFSHNTYPEKRKFWARCHDPLV